jgi:Fe-S-cluster containining protein
MNRAQRRKKSKNPRRRAGTAGGSRPTARVNQAIANAAKDNVLSIIGQGRAPEQALEIAVSAFFLADHLTWRFESEQDLPHPLACREDCASSCYNQVELTPPEALLIGHHIAENLSSAEKDLVLATAARNINLTAGKSQSAIAAMRRELPCPLLIDRRCSVYPVRPLVCRAMHGFDRERCEAELHAGSLASSTYYAHRHDIGVSVSAGLREGCRAAGLQAGTLNLARALKDFFGQQNPAERWIAGEKVFGA